jgi:hypothetical protein
MANISKKSFALCRFSIAIMFWLVIITKFKMLLILPLTIMLISALFGVSKAPIILLGNIIFGKKDIEVVSVQSIRFAHYFGSIVTIIALVLFYFKLDIAGWIVTSTIVVLQTIAAFGYCSAQKLYECLILGKNCCNLGKKIRGGKCNVR